MTATDSKVMVGYLDIAKKAEAVWLAENQRQGYDRNDQNDRSPLQMQNWQPNSPPASMEGDWRAFVFERMARIVSRGHIHAERLAYEAAVVAVLGDGALVHYGGAHGQQCWRDHQVKARERAVTALAELGIQSP